MFVLALITVLLLGCRTSTPPPLRIPPPPPLAAVTVTPIPTGIGPSAISPASSKDQGGYFAEGQSFPYPTPELTTGGPYVPDEQTLLMLHFDGYYAGTQDEPGTAQDTSFAEGRYGQGVLIDNADTLTYTTAGNLNPEAGTNQATTPPEAIGSTFFVGTSPDLPWQADAVVDELHISDVPRLGNVNPIELTGSLLVDSQAGRLYASGRVGEEPKTFVLAATDGRLLATYDVTGTLGLDSIHGWLYVDRDDQGLAVLDAQTGALQTTIPLPDSGVAPKAYAWPGPAPQADPATGQVLAFRDNVVYVADPETGVVTRKIPFNIPQAEDCRLSKGPLRIEWATYDSARRILYLDFETYVCTPWIGHTLVSYDMTSGTEIAQRGVSPPFSATAFDGYLYGSSWFRMGDGFRWAWRDGRPWFESSGWSYGAPGFEVDPTRQWLYGLDGGGLHVFDARTMALIMITPLPVDGQLVGYDPKTDQLYFHVNGGLRPWPASAIQPPTPQPLSVSDPPTTSVRSLLVSPTWLQDKTLFGIWNAEDLLEKCWVFGGFGGPLYVSDDEGVTWSRSRGGLPDGCENFSALAVSPDYVLDRTLLAGVIGLGLFRSTDGGQLWEPSSAGLLSMNIEQILLSPGFARDGTAFAREASAGGRREVYRSSDGGHSWQALDINLDLVAMSPEFDQDHTLMGVVYSYVDHVQRSELHISRDGGDRWERVGNTPHGKTVY